MVLIYDFILLKDIVLYVHIAPEKKQNAVIYIKGTCCGCVSGASAYLSCVFYVVIDVHYSHKGLSNCYIC